ncbi:hypothetical protein C8J55DRAFT_500271 [Lentinula edodes]|uniref:Uncharacterized protein n=1 Tax=Lentinula lateritia TaxID=40482 RepID=A0A9W9AZ72_9AGAR|nr:hypothetical protein C8J55DRAFT_500271 [Lentinula edodes]
MLLQFHSSLLQQTSMYFLLATVFFSAVSVVIAVPISPTKAMDLVSGHSKPEDSSKWALRVGVKSPSSWKRIPGVRISMDDIAVLFIGSDKAFAATTHVTDKAAAGPLEKTMTLIQPSLLTIPKWKKHIQAVYYVTLQNRDAFFFSETDGFDEKETFDILRSSSRLEVEVGPPADMENPDLDYIDRALKLFRKVGCLKGDLAQEKWHGFREQIRSDRVSAMAKEKEKKKAQ